MDTVARRPEFRTFLICRWISLDSISTEHLPYYSLAFQFQIPPRSPSPDPPRNLRRFQLTPSTHVARRDSWYADELRTRVLGQALLRFRLKDLSSILTFALMTQARRTCTIFRPKSWGEDQPSQPRRDTVSGTPWTWPSDAPDVIGAQNHSGDPASPVRTRDNALKIQQRCSKSGNAGASAEDLNGRFLAGNCFSLSKHTSPKQLSAVAKPLISMRSKKGLLLHCLLSRDRVVMMATCPTSLYDST
ncbi:hypothetical protein F5Y18DRAFT_252042 [Xylariaceae sp. FL1019]|nr:hypothetical protein F5Y18DRAFT_252042 [Xylariaceae sp. FL1019]